MPPSHIARLEEIRDTSGRRDDRPALWLDGRSEKIMTHLADLGFVERIDTDPKNPRCHLYMITPAGLVALERVARGVDPYLRMTA